MSNKTLEKILQIRTVPNLPCLHYPSLLLMDEDFKIMHRMDQTIPDTKNAGEMEQWRDFKSALDYRIHFKQAIQTSLDVADHVLTAQRGSSEL